VTRDHKHRVCAMLLLCIKRKLYLYNTVRKVHLTGICHFFPNNTLYMMTHLKSVTLVICIALHTFTLYAQSKEFNLSLSKQIDSLANVDQSVLTMENPDSAAWEFQRIIRSNFPIIKNIADKFGFPGYELVGKESSNNYWMLVQHSDFDVPFQKRLLELMKQKVDKKDASGQNYAYLIDRININEGKKQIYGTQVMMGENGTKLKPCINTRNLDRRRRSVGLESIVQYLKRCDEMFYEMNKDKAKASEN